MMRNPLHLASRSFVTLGLSIALAGCAPVASQLSEATVESAVGTVSETETLQKIDRISASPEFQHSLERVSGSLVRGIVHEVGGVDVDMKDVDDAAEDLGYGLGRGVGRGLVVGMGGVPNAGDVVDDAISGALASATTDQNRARTQLLASEVTATIVRTAIASMAQGIDQSLSAPPPVVDPAAGTPVAQVATATPPAGLQHALGGMVREVSRQATLGFDEGMEDIRESNRAEHEGILGRGAAVGWVVVLALLGVSLLGAIAIIVVLTVANGRRRSERERMLTTMGMMFASHGNGFDEAARVELLRQLGIPTSNLPLQKQASP